MKKIIKQLYKTFLGGSMHDQKASFAQCGEDLIVDFLFTHLLAIKMPTYLDIGAHHPYHLSNTYLFYKRGCTGVSLEPDPSLFGYIKKIRPNDVNINKGVGFNKQSQVADFYILSYKALNTFSRIDAERITNDGHYKIDAVQPVELININSILTSYFGDKGVDFLSIDVEGLDFEILQSIDFSLHQPKVICVETIVFSPGNQIDKAHETINFLVSQGYYNYADTSINTIFVKKDLLKFT